MKDLFFEASMIISWEEVAHFLGVSQTDFKGEMWGDINYTELLKDRAEVDNIISTKVESGYAQGEGFMWYKSFTIEDENGNKITYTNPANCLFDDNYGQWI